MKSIIEHIISNKLSDFKGFYAEGEIPVTEKLLNDLIHELLRKNESSQSESGHQPAPTGAGFNFNDILDAFDVKDVSIELREKVAVLKIKLRKN